MHKNNFQIALLAFVTTVLQLCQSEHLNLTDYFRWKRVFPRYIQELPPHKCQIFWEFPAHPRQKIEALTADKLQEWEIPNAPFLRWPYRENTLYTVYVGGMSILLSETYWLQATATTQSPVAPQWPHYIKVNIPIGNNTAGDIVLPWRTPLKPVVNTTEYYVVTVFEQTEKIKLPIDEMNFGNKSIKNYYIVDDFKKKYKLGQLWAGNFIEVFIRRMPVVRMMWFNSYEEETDPTPFTTTEWPPKPSIPL